MEPLKPERIQQLLKRPQVLPADIEEYERLLSERFTIDPDVPRSPQQEVMIQARETRLQEIHQKLFGPEVPVVKR
jgi:hypothetical protein